MISPTSNLNLVHRGRRRESGYSDHGFFSTCTPLHAEPLYFSVAKQRISATSRQSECGGVPLVALNPVDGELQLIVPNAVIVSVPTDESRRRCGNVFSKVVEPKPDCIRFDE